MASKEEVNLEDVDEKEVLDSKQGSIIMGIISQLRKGSDLSKVTLPTFVLEPRSMVERITDFMSHPELLFSYGLIAVSKRRTADKPDPVDRFLDVLRYFLSGFHIRPHGVKKPYNPVLGEFFRCRYQLENNTSAYYISEQVEHHPPISAYAYMSPANRIQIVGAIKPRPKFLGNSAATIMEGSVKIEFDNLSEEYHLTNPNIYARGILFGTMYMELGDNVTVKCEENDLICELEFKVKGFFTGTYNGISGKVKHISTGEVLYQLNGKWSDVIYIQKGRSKENEVFFDASQHKICQKTVSPLEEQEEYESRRLWANVTKALNSRDQDAATAEKTKVEDRQRALRNARNEKNEAWIPRFFVQNGDDWEFKTKIPKNSPSEAQKILESAVFSKASDPVHEKFW